MDSLNESLSLEQFMAGCDAVSAHQIGGAPVGPNAHLPSMTVPVRTLEITPVKNVSAPSPVAGSTTTMSLLTPVKSERLSGSGGNEDHTRSNPTSSHNIGQPSIQHTSHSSSLHHGVTEHTTLPGDTRNVKTEGTPYFLNITSPPLFY